MTYKPTELLYSAGVRCTCGAGMAYPLDHSAAMELARWVCADVLLGKVELDQEKTREAQEDHGMLSPTPLAESSGRRHIALPFSLFEVKSESQPSASGHTTRPAGTHIEIEPRYKCKLCETSWVGPRARPWEPEPGDVACPKCGERRLNADGSSNLKIDARYPSVVVEDAAAKEPAA